MLEVQGLRKMYGKNLAVDQVSFFVPDGRVGILLGPNGAGKSTIIKSIAGLLRYEGMIRIQGIPSRELEAKRIFGYVPEIPSMFEALSVREHIQYIRMAYKSPVTDQEVESLLDRFEMTDKADKLGNELSKGMMQKVSILCALAVKPQVILFDEPMVGLDPQAIRELKEAHQHPHAGDGGGAVGRHVCNGKGAYQGLFPKGGCRRQGPGRPVL